MYEQRVEHGVAVQHHRGIQQDFSTGCIAFNRSDLVQDGTVHSSKQRKAETFNFIPLALLVTCSCCLDSALCDPKSALEILKATLRYL